MKFLHVDPAAKTITSVEYDDVGDAYRAIIKRDVDHGRVQRGLGIFVYEYGLLEGEGPYFSLNGQLYSGDAILFSYDEAGDTIDVPDDLMLQPHWFPDKSEVELAIVAGIVQRPYAAANVWRWS